MRKSTRTIKTKKHQTPFPCRALMLLAVDLLMEVEILRDKDPLRSKHYLAHLTRKIDNFSSKPTNFENLFSHTSLNLSFIFSIFTKSYIDFMYEQISCLRGKFLKLDHFLVRRHLFTPRGPQAHLPQLTGPGRGAKNVYLILSPKRAVT